MENYITNNSIELKAIGDLMNGDLMFIPSYQRGYRWTEAQVHELLSDLLSFAYNHKNGNSFYCLQPIIAQDITDDANNKIDGFDEIELSEKNKVWEIVDGQQRLTTIFILYRYLMKKLKIDDEELLDENKRIRFKIRYQTRKNSTFFLEDIDDDSLECNNMDYYHFRSTYKAIDKWIKSEDGGPKIAKRYNKDDAPKQLYNVFFDLLNAQRGLNNNNGSVQVVWYELDKESNVIEEFRNLNAGKIYLTDAELVKALFLKKQKGTSNNEQLERAMKWENIENELHRNDFWYFLNPANFNMANRIDFIFQLIHRSEYLKDIPEENWDENLIECEKQLESKNFIFNKYYEKFDILDTNQRNIVWKFEWDQIEQTFEDLKDWYEDTICYNLLGLLSQFISVPLKSGRS